MASLEREEKKGAAEWNENQFIVKFLLFFSSTFTIVFRHHEMGLLNKIPVIYCVLYSAMFCCQLTLFIVFGRKNATEIVVGMIKINQQGMTKMCTIFTLINCECAHHYICECVRVFDWNLTLFRPHSKNMPFSTFYGKIITFKLFRREKEMMTRRKKNIHCSKLTPLKCHAVCNWAHGTLCVRTSISPFIILERDVLIIIRT